jgi:hypothetical protein
MTLLLLIVIFIKLTLFIEKPNLNLYFLFVKASIQFDIPIEFIRDTLIFTNLNDIRYVIRFKVQNDIRFKLQSELIL